MPEPTALTDTATSFLTMMSALSTAVQQFVEHVIKKRITWLDKATPEDKTNEERRASTVHVTTFLVGALLTWSVDLKPLHYLGLDSDAAKGPLINAVLAGVMISFGSSFFDEALGGLREWKKAQEAVSKK
jgi:hypothetical protein